MSLDNMQSSEPPLILGIDHVQLAAPAGCEQAARDFYGRILELRELPKPEALRQRGGCWFQCGTHQIHIGVDLDFRPAKKAHPAIAVRDLSTLRAQLANAGIPVQDDDAIPGDSRFYSEDPWGNRLEFVQVG
jgi:catechol 2,3-dioxygenase-like lactoylglutathione lyase family enzyme